MKNKKNYEELRRTKLYKKDYKTETLPWDEIEREILGLAKHSGDIEVSIESTFFNIDPLTGERLLEEDHPSSLLKKIEDFLRVNKFRIDLSLASKEGQQSIKIKKKTKRKEEIKKFTELLSHLDLDFSHLSTFKGRVKGPEVDKGFKKVCYSKAIEGYLKTIGTDIKGMSPKHPYKEAYFWKDIDEIAEYYKEGSPIVLSSTIDREVSVRCFRSKDGKLKTAKKGMSEEEYRKWVKKLEEEGQSESGIRRYIDGKPIKINTKKDLIKIVYKLGGFEIIPVLHPKDLTNFSEQECEKYEFLVVIDFDNKQRDYGVGRDYINTIVEKLEENGIEGSLWLTGTKKWGAHYLIYITPKLEGLFPPPKTETYESWSSKPLGRKVLDSLKAYFQALGLKIIASKDLECGINPANSYEAIGCEMIAEVKCDYRNGVKAPGSLNSSVRWGAKAPSEENRMPKTLEEYKRLTSREHVLDSLSEINKYIKERKNPKKNFEKLVSYLPLEEGLKIYKTYNESSYLPPKKVRYLIKKKLGY